MQEEQLYNLTLTKLDIVIIYALLRNVRLGDRNKYEGAVSRLMIDAEANGIEDFLGDEVLPDLLIEASNQDGVVINLV